MAVVSAADSSNSVVVSIVNGEKKLSRLWQEGSDFTVRPSTENALSVVLESDGVALEAWYLNSQELLSALRVPHSDVIDRASGEEFRVAHWESNIVNSLIVTGVSQLRTNLVSIAPVNGRHGSTTEEVSAVSGKRNRSNRSHDLGLGLDEHVLDADLGNGTISSSDQKISVCNKGDAVDTLGEEFLGWSNSLEELLGERNFNDVSSLSSQISKLVIVINDAAGENSLDLAHNDVMEVNFLLDKVAVP